jgi:transposase
MWALPAATRIYLAAGSTDLRKGFDGLYGRMRDRLQICPQSGHLALFCNRDRTRLKLLYWDGTGLWLCTKRLERGRFSWPAAATTGEGRVVLSQEELTLLLGGIELRQTRRKAWYGRPAEKVTQAA